MNVSEIILSRPPPEAPDLSANKAKLEQMQQRSQRAIKLFDLHFKPERRHSDTSVDRLKILHVSRIKKIITTVEAPTPRKPPHTFIRERSLSSPPFCFENQFNEAAEEPL